MPEYLYAKLQSLKLLAFDFDGVFTDGKVIVYENGKESVVCSRKDTLRFPELRDAGIEIVVISKEQNRVVAKRSKKMGVKYYHGIDDKLSLFKEILEQQDLDPSECAFVGDDINDLEVLKYAGVAITVADGHEECKKLADYTTERKGGDHAVREICDLILEARQRII